MCVIDILLSLFLKKTWEEKFKLDLPTINAPATQMSTVNEVLNQSLSIMRGLGLTKIVCVFDQDQAWPISHHLHTAGNNRKAFPRCWTPRPVHSVWHDRGRLCCGCHGWPQATGQCDYTSSCMRLSCDRPGKVSSPGWKQLT